MQPSPPAAMKASAVASSPDNSRNPGATSDLTRIGRVTSPVPSLSPMNWLDCASRASVSSDNSRIVRDGISCRMIGRAVECSDRAKVRLNAGLHRLVVVRHDRKHRIGAGSFGAPRQLDGLAGRIRSRPGNDSDAAPRDLDAVADDAVVLEPASGSKLRRRFRRRRSPARPLRSAVRKALRRPRRSNAPSSSKGVGRSGM